MRTPSDLTNAFFIVLGVSVLIYLDMLVWTTDSLNAAMEINEDGGGVGVLLTRTF